MKIDYASLQLQFEQLHKQGCTPTLLKMSPDDCFLLMQSVLSGYRKPDNLEVCSVVNEANHSIVPIWLEQDYSQGTLIIQWEEG